MKNSIIIKAKSSPEFLERLLRVCRHRGFYINNMSAKTDPAQQTLLITLDVDSDREVSLLTKQIEKVIGVLEVIASSQEEIKASA